MQLLLEEKAYPHVIRRESTFDVIGYDLLEPDQVHCLRLG